MEEELGCQVLGAVEEASLQEVLEGFRKGLHTHMNQEFSTSNNTKPVQLKATHWVELDAVNAHHHRATQSSTVSVCGRSLPMLYKFISNLVSPPHLMAVFVLDLDSRFDATCLTADTTHCSHVYILRPPPTLDNISAEPDVHDMVADAQNFMLYGGVSQESVSRPWWGTVVLGGNGLGDFVTSWKGWLRVDREHVRGFAQGISAIEALEQRTARQKAVDAAGWVASSQWGSFVFHEDLWQG